MQQIRPPGSRCHFALLFFDGISVKSHCTQTHEHQSKKEEQMSKVKVITAEEAALLVKDNDTVVCAGFIASNIP